ncbi:MAG: hypothetical protein K8R41_01770 [Bacteroidales bacterium]|nr:hypothetical protein [Bacteroidales bacterium]
MTRIEEKIRNNKDHFNQSEPADGHFDRFKDKLSQLHSEDENENKFSFNIVWKIAASVIVLIAISLVFIINTPDSKSAFAVNATIENNLPEELEELDKYYAQQTDKKMCTINELTDTCCENTDFKKIAENQILELSNSRKELQKDYSDNKDDERTFSAIVNNYRLLSKVLDGIIETINNK